MLKKKKEWGEQEKQLAHKPVLKPVFSPPPLPHLLPDPVCCGGGVVDVVVRCLGLLAAHELEVVDLLELGDDELAVHVVHLQLQAWISIWFFFTWGTRKKTTNERRARENTATNGSKGKEIC